MESHSAFLFTICLPVAIILIMFSMGLGLRLQDFSRLIANPKVNIVGLGLKLIAMPLIACALIVIFNLQAEFAVGLILVAAGPGGITALVFTRMAKGDLALGLTLTAIDNLLVAFTLPLYAGLAMSYFNQGTGGAVGVPFSESAKIFVLLIVPSAIGMFIRAKFPGPAARVEHALRAFSIFVVVTLILVILLKERESILSNLATLGGATMLLSLLGAAVGYSGARLFGCSRGEAIAISTIMSMQGTAFIATVAISVFHNMAYAAPAGVYSLGMYLTAFLGAALFTKVKSLAV